MTKLTAPALAFSCALVLAGGALSQQGPDLDAIATDYAAAVDANDAAALARLYAEDAVVHSPDGGRVEGRAAIESHFSDLFAEGAIADMRIEAQEEEQLGDAVLAIGGYEMTMTAPDGRRLPVTGAYYNLLREVDGEWLIVRQIWNNDLAAGQSG